MDHWLYFYLIPFLVALAISFVLVPVFRKIAIKFGVVHQVRVGFKQDIHKKPMPLLGGWAIVLSFLAVVLLYALFDPSLLSGLFLPKYLIGIIAAAIVLLVGGSFDDKFDLHPRWQFIAPILAVLVIIASGIGINFISNPLGEAFSLDTFSLSLFEIDGLPYQIIIWADVFTFIWLMGMIFTAKYLDGVDGLSSSVMGEGFIIIFLLSISSTVAQPELGFLAIVMAGAILGFWPHNFYKARIFMGEGGVMFMGLMLGVLAILSGGKIATALLVMGVPIIDTARVILMRIFKKKSPFKGDDTHLHHLLLKLGLKPWQVVLVISAPGALFGALALVLQGLDKVVALLVLFISMIVFVVILGVVLAKRQEANMS